MNCGNFLNSTDAKSCGVEVGYGKLFLIYAETDCKRYQA